MAPTPIKESSIYGDFSSIASRTNSKATANPTLDIVDAVEMSMDDFAEKNSSGSLAVKDLLINFFSDQKVISPDKEIRDEEPYTSTKILIFSFIWAVLAALHKASTI